MLLHQTVGGERKSKTAFFCGDSPLDLKCEDDREMLRIDYAAYGNAIDIRDGDLKAAEAKSDVSECLGGGADDTYTMQLATGDDTPGVVTSRFHHLIDRLSSQPSQRCRQQW